MAMTIWICYDSECEQLQVDPQYAHVHTSARTTVACEPLRSPAVYAILTIERDCNSTGVDAHTQRNCNQSHELNHDMNEVDSRVFGEFAIHS